MNFTEICNQFMTHCESAVNLSHHTLRAYRSDLEDCQKYLGGRKKIDSIQKDKLRNYIRDLRENRKFKETTIKRRLASLKLVFHWAQEQEMLSVNPFNSFNERIRLPKRLPRGLDHNDQSKLRKALTINTKTDSFDIVREKTAIRMLLDTGLRVGELVSIQLSDISIGNHSLVINGKGNRQRLVYLLQKPLMRSVENYLKLRNELQPSRELLFVSSSGQPIQTSNVRLSLRKLAFAAGISKRVTPHMLRHTCATQWLEDGLDIRYVQKLLGHQSISTTEIYTHVSDQSLRQALLRVGHNRR